MKFSVSTVALCAVLAAAVVNAQNTSSSDTKSVSPTTAPSIIEEEGNLGDPVAITNTNTRDTTTAPSPTTSPTSSPLSPPTPAPSSPTSSGVTPPNPGVIGEDPVNISAKDPNSTPNTGSNVNNTGNTGTTPTTSQTSTTPTGTGAGEGAVSNTASDSSKPVSGDSKLSGSSSDDISDSSDSDSEESTDSESKKSGAVGVKIPAMSLTALVVVAVSAAFF
ncbi:hypothetical protein GGI20_005707 [Coemansia sp. BCRC 34301]|nr:hypothetical protein GGI20_005707 [Coemansia sp. BCRC 34301]